jgi:hypothetical protein
MHDKHRNIDDLEIFIVIASHFATASRVPDMDRISQVQRGNNFRNVRSISVQ